jgi:protein PhnA
MSNQPTPNCIKCGCEYTYENGGMYVCPECSCEWSKHEVTTQIDEDENREEVIKDASGNVLKDGDTITVIKDLKVKGSSSVVKVGTKVKNIRLVNGDHDIDCKIPGIGQMGLKSEFVRKVME